MVKTYQKRRRPSKTRAACPDRVIAVGTQVRGVGPGVNWKGVTHLSVRRVFSACRLSVVAALVVFGGVAKADEVRFSRDVLPILSDRCFHCHGPDPKHREADLRLDERESAIAVREGTAAIVPGKPAESELLRRISSRDP